jgi:5-methyltetrahydrofolate--homocysteine methyltransferase
MNKLTERLSKNKVLIADGATGTNLQQRGLLKGTAPEVWVLERPDEIIRLERDFINAGSEVVLTCTFGASSLRLNQNGLAGKTEEINLSAVELARTAVEGKEVLVGGSMGPLGHMLKPLGDLDIDVAKINYQEQAGYLANAGVDFLVIETQYDLAEVRIAIDVAKKISDLPIVCSFSYDRGIRTMMGVKPSQAAQELNDLGITAIGINCGKSLEDNLKCLIELRQSTQLPIWFKPNAGMPKVDLAGNTTYGTSPEDMGEQATRWIAEGASIIGGCCGTSPAHVMAIADAVKK